MSNSTLPSGVPLVIPNGGDDAICFTSGPSGAPFAAGVIHAWLAIDREPPLVAAGISTGAISAAAMRRVYQELASASTVDREQKRWEWYRRYLTAIIQNPTAVIWDSVPGPVDFFGTIPPVQDLSVPPPLFKESEEARRHYYLLTRLGIWLANLPIRVSTLATLVVMYIRKKERYGSRFRGEWSFNWNFAKIALGLSWHILISPNFILEKSFASNRPKNFHPLFGIFWYINLVADALLVAVVALVAIWLHGGLLPAWVATCSFVHVHSSLSILLTQTIGWAATTVLTLATVALGATVTSYIFFGLRAVVTRLVGKVPLKRARQRPTFFNEFLRATIFEPLDITKAILHPYEVKRRLHDLFNVGSPPFRDGQDVHLLIVCAALEETDQVLLDADPNVVDALTAAVAAPGLFPPQTVKASSVVSIRRDNLQKRKTYQIIDGAAIRANPIPAFFNWCKQPKNRSFVNRIEGRSQLTPSLHVVYNVPISYPGSAQDAPPTTCPDIVESSLQALQLEKRRDTRQEVRQTNYMSKVEDIRRTVTGDAPSELGPFGIYADEIAPREEIDTGNSLSPDPNKLMQIVANGCRATLESLYRQDILQMTGGASIQCPKFLGKIAKRRDPSRTGFVTGLPEVCASCAGVLEYRAIAVNEAPPGIIRSYGNKGNPPRLDLGLQFDNLSKKGPKVVFLGSGGVFRGAFHIGVIAAMAESQLYPDLVIGASVGALMGGALCNLSAGPKISEIDVLFRLASLFLNVDRKVSLTRTLKNATKQLGTRARYIRLSPSELTRMVEKGSQADPGFAATGAPPALIDALSSLFMIPHRETGDIASHFVAGHISEATVRFLGQLRKESLPSFNIQTAIMGVSMLADQARALLGQGTKGVDLSSVQPYHHPDARKKVSFFCTTSFLNARMSILLGRDFLTPDPTWDGLYAGLSSSAFPAVFAPRTEADFLPGKGRTDRYFADGGLFDNLPFFSAIEILSAVQRSDNKEDSMEIIQAVNERVSGPDLFIAAGLKAKPASEGRYDTLFRIKDRAESLSVESKTGSFTRAADKTLRDFASIVNVKDNPNFAKLSDADLAFLDGSVCAKIVSISPTDPEHINPTFAFCRSTGLEKKRVQESIADGCFQSLAEFASNKSVGDLLQPSQKITLVDLLTQKTPVSAPKTPLKPCPFYRKDGKALACPFTRTPTKTSPPTHTPREESEVSSIWERCSADRAHKLTQSRWPKPKLDQNESSMTSSSCGSDDR